MIRWWPGSRPPPPARLPATAANPAGKWDLNKRGVAARYFAATDEIIDYLVENDKEGDVMAILSNGGFDNIQVRLLERLAA